LITVYGIKQCDTCHKALKWLSEHAIEHQFHDVREQGLSKAQVTTWANSDYGEELLNRRSTTWRTLSQAQKDAHGEERIQLLVDNPTLIKRPVFVDGSVIAVGFSPAKLLPILKAS
jgi:arsenate reductase